jgi:hypothetical protein
MLLSCLAWHEVGLLRRLFGFAKIPICFVSATDTAQNRNSSYGLMQSLMVLLQCHMVLLTLHRCNVQFWR